MTDTYASRIRRSSNYISTPYAMCLADDDICLKVGLCRAIDKLNQDNEILACMHPLTPFITEEIWSNIKASSDGNLFTTSWPDVDDKLINNAIELDAQLIMNIIKEIRNIKVTLSISPAKPIALILRGNEKKPI